MHRLISSKNKVFLPIDGSYESALLVHDENTNSKKLWIEMLEKENLNTNCDGVDINTLFDLVKKAFEAKFHCTIDASFISMYIAANDGDSAVKHDHVSRAFTTGNTVYIDKLMVNVLFEYVANYYLWARFGSEVFSFCFPYALNLIDICCRQGFINSDENVSSLLNVLAQKCDARAYIFISDLYWSIIAFIMCHELAHIYIDDTLGDSISSRDAEILADEYGYTVFLSLIDHNDCSFESPFLDVFQDYLYAAPLVLFLFYEDLYFMEYWVYGEKIALHEHSSFSNRISRLHDISREIELNFELDSGDAVLNNFWDISDYFREELVYKLKNGKLTDLIQKGYRNMNNTTGYEQALNYDNKMQSILKKYAQEKNINPGKLIGLYNIAAKYEVLDSDIAEHSLVRSVNDKIVSVKPYNLKFQLFASLSAIIDTGVTLFSPGELIPTVMQLINILITLIGDSVIEISEEQSRVLIECHKRHAYSTPIDEIQLLITTNATHKTIDELCSLKCIELIDGKVRLIENIAIQ